MTKTIFFRKILAGEEVTESYGVTFIETPKKQRQKKLLDQYKFQCRCVACENDFPVFKDLDKLLPDGLTAVVETGLRTIHDNLAVNEVENAQKHITRLVDQLDKHGLPYLHSVQQRCRVLLGTCLRLKHS